MPMMPYDNNDARLPEVPGRAPDEGLPASTMGPMLQARLWAREAPVAERRAGWIAGLLLFAVVAWALVPTGRAGEDGEGLAATGDDAAQTGADGFVADAAGDAGAVADGGAAEAGGTGVGTVAGGAGGTARGPGSSAGTGTAAGTGGGGGGSGTTTPVALTASDTGITKDTVKLGFAVFDLGGAQQVAGSVPGFRDDTPAVIDALVKHANDTGGVHGRRIVPVKKAVDLINAGDQHSKCTAFAKDDKVFAVVDSFNFLYPQTRACLTVDNRVPLVTHEGGTVAEMTKAAPMQISGAPTHNRQAQLWVAAAKQDGFFDPAQGFKRLGILTDNCDRNSVDDPKTGLKAWLRNVGVDTWTEVEINCDYNTMTGTGPSSTLAMRRDGVSHVMLGVYSLAARSFIQAAAAQKYDFEYYASDYRGPTSDGIAKDFDPDQYDRVRGVTTWRTGEQAAGKPLGPRALACSKILTDAGLKPVTAYVWDAEALMLCDNLDIFLRAARAAPPNLKRADVGTAAQRLPEFDLSWDYPARFAPGLFSAGGRTQWARLEWRRECTCWHQIRGPEAVGF